MRIDVARIFAAHEAARAQEIADREARSARRLQLGAEIAVLGAMVTSYDFELFADVEVDDFADFRNRLIMGAIRTLEHAGRVVDGEILLGDIADEIDKAIRFREEASAFGASLKPLPPVDPELLALLARALDARLIPYDLAPPAWKYLDVLVAQPRWVVPCRDASSTAAAIEQLRLNAITRTLEQP